VQTFLFKTESAQAGAAGTSQSLAAPPRFVVIYLPDFLLQSALRAEPELASKPVALIDAEQPKSGILEMSSAAWSAGVRPGQTPTQALARCRAIEIRNCSRDQESVAQQTLLQSAYSFSPFIEDTAPGICTLELRGHPDLIAPAAPVEQPELNLAWDGGLGEIRSPRVDRLQSWARQIVDRLGQFHLQARVGIAANPGLALQAARCADPVLEVGDGREFLAALPMETVDPSMAVLRVLRGWGIRRLGEFTALGRAAVVERLGLEGAVLFDRASANESRPLRFIDPPEVFEEFTEFATAIETLEPLLFILRRFLEQLSKRLELAGLVAEELHLTLQLDSGESYERAFRIPAPTRNIETLFRMLHTHLENVRTEHPVAALRLRANPCLSAGQQLGLFEAALRDPNHFYETLARLTALLGPGRVGTPVVQPTHRDDDFRMEKPRFTGVEEARPARKTAEVEGASPEIAPPRLKSEGLALRRFRPPIPVNVELDRERPAALSGSRVRGKIERASGPWRSSGNWWDQFWSRDEWDVQTGNGRLYRLCRQGEEWIVDGTFD
jgi:protein ImuB